jgi:copper chaperone
MTTALNFLQSKAEPHSQINILYLLMEIKVENIKCSGCAHSIKSALLKLNGAEDVEVNVVDGVVKVMGDVEEKVVIEKLHSMGYPLPGMGTGLTTATSYVSCMIGKINA